MGGSSKNKPQTVTQKQDPWGPTQPYWMQSYADIFGKPTGATSQAGGGRYPGGSLGFEAKGGSGSLNPADYTGRYGSGGLIGQQLENPNQNITQGWDMTRAAAMDPTNTQTLTGARDYTNRVLSGEFLDPTKNLALSQQLQRGLEGMGSWDTSAVQAGRYGSDAWAAGRGRELADLQGNLYGQGLQQMTQMAGMAPSIYESQYMPSQKLLALGQEMENRPWDIYSRGAQMLSGPQGGSTSSPYFQPNPLLGLAGTGLLAYGMGAFSDRRLKTNIIKLGKAKGYNVYSFDYIWGEPSVGVMADEVEKIRPEAVSEYNGYKMVNYSML